MLGAFYPHCCIMERVFSFFVAPHPLYPSSSRPLFVCLPPAEFSRESLLEAAGGLECPLSKEKGDCSGVASAADPSSQQNNAQAGTRGVQRARVYAGILSLGGLFIIRSRGRVYSDMLNRLGSVSRNHGLSANICEAALIRTSQSAAVAGIP